MSLFPRIEKGLVANDGLGDHPRTVATKINSAFDTLDIILEKPISDATAASGSANSAAASQAAAAASQTASAASAGASSGSATASAVSAAAALVSQTAAAGSATTAGTGATTATTQAGIATTQAGIATTQAGIAIGSATAAGASQTNAATSETNAGTSATAAGTSASNAATSATNSAASAAKLTATSTTSLAIGTGSKVFTTQANKDFNLGTSIWAIDSADITRYMFGTVTAYSGVSLTINVVATNNTGTYASWNLYGRAGPQGAPNAGTGDVVGPNSSTNGNVPTFSGTTGKLIADTGKPAPAGAFVGTTDAQTLTNKTLTAPAVSSPTGIVKGDVGLGNADNTSDATKNAAAVTLTNKTLNSATNTLTGFNAAGSDVITGTDTAKFVTAKAIADSHAWLTLTSGATPAWNAANGYNARITLSVNFTAPAPSNLIDGRTYVLGITQAATGGPYTISFNAIWDFGGAGAPSASTTASAYDMVIGVYDASRGKIGSSFRKGT